MTMMRAWVIGLAAGLVVGLGTLVAGYLAALFGLVAIIAATRLPRREATAAGLLLGLGGAWILLLLRADLACGVDCTGPDLTGWYVVGAALAVLGAILTVRAARSATMRAG
jgi:hypothetical protein